jgi:hypothetical protein
VVPDLTGQPGVGSDLAEQVAREADELAAGAGHLRLHRVATEGLRQALEQAPVRLSTMGRGLDEDPAAFLAAAAAGRHAARLVGPPPGNISG